MDTHSSLLVGGCVIVGLSFCAGFYRLFILSFLAGMGLACSRADDGTGKSIIQDQTKPTTVEQPPVMMCYAAGPPPPAFSNPKWQESAELRAWAQAEKALLDYSHLKNLVPDTLMEIIGEANKARIAAQKAVNSGIISAKVFELASEILGEWHKDLATSKGSVKCYKSMPPEPIVQDSSEMLWQLESLSRQGKINTETANEVRTALRTRLSKELSSSDTEQLVALLNGLLGLR